MKRLLNTHVAALSLRALAAPAAVGTAVLAPAAAFAQTAAPDSAPEIQESLIGVTQTWGFVAVAVIAAIVGFGIIFAMVKRSK